MTPLIVAVLNMVFVSMSVGIAVFAPCSVVLKVAHFAAAGGLLGFAIGNFIEYAKGIKP